MVLQTLFEHSLYITSSVIKPASGVLQLKFAEICYFRLSLLNFVTWISLEPRLDYSSVNLTKFLTLTTYLLSRSAE